MAQGGARSRSGPAPDPNALRRNRNDDSEWVTLPADGRPGPPPEWPLLEHSDREMDLWFELWGKPQAVMWEHLGLIHEVALLVRRMTEAELPGSPANLSTLVKQLSEDLGLTVAGMRTNRWVISDQPATGTRAPRSNASRSSTRDRLRVAK